MDFSDVTALIDTMPKRGIPFFDLVVCKDSKIIYRHKVGKSDVKGEKELEDNDLYWLYSTSKITTCVCALRLLERGVIKLSDPVSKYIPAYASLTVRNEGAEPTPCKTVMTVEHLFTMTSGIGPEHENKELLQKYAQGPTTIEIASAIAKIPLYFEPGTRYKYGFSHDVLAAVVEAASGVKFSEYAIKNVFEPLGMTNTGFRPTSEQEKRLCATYVYDNSNGTSKQIPTSNPFALTPEYDSGGAGLFSCATDYIKLLSTLANSGTAENGYVLLKKETVEQIQVNRLNKDSLSDFVNGRLHGYGWGLCGRVHINPVFSLSKSPVGEFGWDGAGGCFAVVDTKNKISMFFGMQVHNCSYSYIILQPLVRTLVYKALEK